MTVIADLFTIEATVATPTGSATVDGEGNATPGYDTATVMVHRQPVAKRTTSAAAEGSEDVVDVETSIDYERIWAALDAPIRHDSLVTIGAEEFVVVGAPKRWEVGDPDDHLALMIRRVTR